MKICELSIGDWVRHTFYEENLQIKRIDGESERLLVEKGLMSVSCHLDHFEPIPLTPEILEKNGFVDYEVGKGWYVLNVADDLRVWLHRNSHDWTFQLMKWSPLSTHEIGKVFINHTHQLQHALRLAGIGKEIEV